MEDRFLKMVNDKKATLFRDGKMYGKLGNEAKYYENMGSDPMGYDRMKQKKKCAKLSDAVNM